MKTGIRHIIFSGLAAISLISACEVEGDLSGRGTELPSEGVFGAGLPEDRLTRKMNIRVTEETSSRFETLTDRKGYVDLSGLDGFEGKGIIRMRRLFPHAGEFEGRTREAGLHLWYVLEYDEGVSMTKASSGLVLPGVVEIEHCPKIHIIGAPDCRHMAEDMAPTKAGGSYDVFDDPMLDRQWHYYNTGTVPSSVSGCDINVFPVWRNYSRYAVYEGDIIVGVVDGGIDYAHEDLKDNMWRNPENHGDNVYGYNFAADTYNIHPDDHGTHVAGTIAAVNNNGTGVCGVAGGDAEAGIKGARLMSCQIFDGNMQGAGAEAIKWSADHGAVISQNSWGYDGLTETPSSLKAAVDYFIANAGTDGNGRQVGPMKGGIVIFAAGNDNTDVSGNDYEKILNVTSVGADYIRAYYTNYGEWCDVAAPGGDAKKGNQVFSTLPGNRYGSMQGTSMACPHVSGIAALILARYGGEGYSPSALRKRIEDNLTDIGVQNAPYYLGKGLVNAYRAIAGSGGKAPETPWGLKVSARSNNLDFSVHVPSDADDGTAYSIYLYYSDKDFSSSSDAKFGVFYVEGLRTGDVLTGHVGGLQFNKEYHVAALAADMAGNKSGMTGKVKVMTGDNNPPVISVVSGTEFRIKAHEAACAQMEISEPDGHFYNIDLVPDSGAAILDTTVRECPKISIKGADAPTGIYTARLCVTDLYGMAAETSVRYEILENHAPVIVRNLENMVFDSKAAGSAEILAADYFHDEDGEELAFSFGFTNPDVANMTYSKGRFLLTPLNYGTTAITVTGTDVRGMQAENVFMVLVNDKDKPAVLYPNPVRDKLNVRVGKAAESLSVRLVSAIGSVFADLEYKDASPFEPVGIDMSSASPGVYTVILRIDGKEYKYRIVKV